MRHHTVRYGLILFVTVFLALQLSASNARVVRLSYVEGDVKIDRNAGTGLESALLNTPVIEGCRLITGSGAFAEVEFENGGTLRLVAGTEVDFKQLSMKSDGGRLSNVNVRRGTVYVQQKLQKHDQYSVTLAGVETTTLKHSSRFRVHVDDAQVTLAVFSGEVSVAERTGESTAKKDETLSLDLREGRHAIAKNIDPLPFDNWDRERDRAHDAEMARAQSYDATSYGYNGFGAYDLTYYGNYNYVPGYGYLWQPYNAGLDWDPFGYGSWSYYPSFGWTYISGYPWGWGPYRYGSWLWVPTYGWMWQPGYSAYWNPVPVVKNPPHGFVPPRAPGRGPGPSLTVGHGPVSTPGAITIQGGVTPRTSIVPSQGIGQQVPGTRGTHTPARPVERGVGVVPPRMETPSSVRPVSPPTRPATPATVAPPAVSMPREAPRISRPGTVGVGGARDGVRR